MAGLSLCYTVNINRRRKEANWIYFFCLKYIVTYVSKDISFAIDEQYQTLHENLTALGSQEWYVVHDNCVNLMSL